MAAVCLTVVTVRRVTTVRQANSSDLGALVESVGNLFRDDALRYGTYATNGTVSSARASFAAAR